MFSRAKRSNAIAPFGRRQQVASLISSTKSSNLITPFDAHLQEKAKAESEPSVALNPCDARTYGPMSRDTQLLENSRVRDILVQMPGADQISSPYFSGHESFTLRFAWLPKAVQGVLQHRNLFTQDDALVHLGVGKNMVRSIRHWGVASGFLDEIPVTKKSRATKPTPSALGNLVFGSQGLDQYLEDSATLWLIHWQLASRPEGPTTWYWAFNEYPEAEFTKEKLCAALRQYIDRQAWKRIADSTIARDVDCFIRTYTPSRRGKTEVFEESLDCPLTELGILADVDGLGVLAFNRGEHPSLPHAIFLYAVVTFWERSAPLLKTLTYDQIAYHPGSPGRVFKLSDSALTDYLESLSDVSDGAVRFGTTAGLRQLYRHRDISDDFATSVLRRYYGAGKGK